MGFHHNISKHNSSPKHRLARRAGRVKLTILSAAVVFTIAVFGSMFSIQNTYARDYNAEIQALQNQANEYKEKASELAAEADTLSNKIAELQNRQDQIQNQIDISEAKKAQLEQEIADKQAQIKTQAEALSKVLQEQYYSNQTSSLDIIMNSDSVSDYVDRQTRQQAMSDQISSATTELKSLKAELEQQKSEVETLIEQQNAQKADLQSTKDEQQQLLDETQGQEDKYNELTAQTNEKIAQVKAELAEANRKMQSSGGMSGGTLVAGAQGSNGSACGGGYPTYLCSAGQDTMVDPWGMYNRECVSYAAYRVASDNGYMPYWGGHGMAYQWYSNAASAGYKITSYPEAGTVAWIGKTSSTPVGHVGFVESVDEANGTYIVSEYNSDGRGNYYKKQYNIGSGFTAFLWISK